MLKFLAKRILSLIPVIFIIAIILFLLVKMMPGSPADVYCNPADFGNEPDALEICRQNITDELGLDDPYPVQFVRWAKKIFIEFDLGQSMKYQEPVSEIVGYYIKNSLVINVFVIFVSFLVAIPIGILSAVKKNTVFDNFWKVFSLLGISLPSFYFAIILIYIFSIQLNLLPISGMVVAGYEHPNTFSYILDVFQHMLLPSIVLINLSLAGTIRYVRNAMLDVLSQDYIRTARAKGLSEKVVIYSHAFRNALIPVVTLVAFSIPGLFGGSAIIESMFKWPGIGHVLIESLSNRDTAITLAMSMFYALLALLANIFMDIGYALVDPRVKFE